MKAKTAFWIFSGILIVLTLLFPGDAPWINDEPILIYNAFISNHQNSLPTYSLFGSMGIPYGPLPVWIYKVLLLISSNLIIVELLKTTITLFVVFISLYFIAKALNYPRDPLLLVFVSPYLFLYSRLLWDNCFLIPASAILLLCLVKFINTHRLFWFIVSLFVIICLIHIHLMSALIIIPFFIFLILFEWKWLLDHRKSMFLIMAVFLFSLVPYTMVILTKSVAGVKILKATTWYNLFSPVRFFSFWGFDDYFVPEMLTSDFVIPSGIYIFLKYLSGIGLAFFILGFAKIALILFNKFLKKIALTADEKFLSFCVITVLFSIGYFTVSKIFVFPHYNNAICLVYFFIIYFCLSFYRNNKIIFYAFWAYFSSMLLLLISFSFYIHMSGGNRTDHYGATLKNQIDIVKQINTFHQESPIYFYVNNLKAYPHSFRVLLLLYGEPEKPGEKKLVKKISILYKKDDKTGWIVLDISTADFPLP